MYDQMRNEQNSNELYRSKTWMDSDQNTFVLKKKEKQSKKDKRHTDKLPPGLERVLQSMVDKTVENSISQIWLNREQSIFDSIVSP